MRRALWFFLKLGLVVAAAVWIARRPGRVAIEWQGWAIETSVGVLALAGLLLVLACIAGFIVWRAIIDSPAAFGRFRHAARRERGYRALTRGMVAVAAGDARTARICARKAEVLLDVPPLTLLLSAQAAQLNGDEGAAETFFRAMLERRETAFLGRRGLLTQAMKRGDPRAAGEHARAAAALQPKAQWPALALLRLEVREGHWTDAERALEAALRSKAVSNAEEARKRAALLAERATDTARDGRTAEALALAQRAHDLRPSLVPAAVLLARLKAQAGETRAARSVIRQAWMAGPHPDLADAWAGTLPDTDTLARVKHFETLLGFDPAAMEGHLALAAAAVRARLWGEARNHLNRITGASRTARWFRLRAELARGEGADASDIRGWEMEAAAAPPDPAWVCAECGTVHAAWRAGCDTCDAVDAIEWRETAASLAPASPRPAMPAAVTHANLTNANVTPAGGAGVPALNG